MQLVEVQQQIYTVHVTTTRNINYLATKFHVASCMYQSSIVLFRILTSM